MPALNGVSATVRSCRLGWTYVSSAQKTCHARLWLAVTVVSLGPGFLLLVIVTPQHSSAATMRCRLSATMGCRLSATILMSIIRGSMVAPGKSRGSWSSRRITEVAPCSVVVPWSPRGRPVSHVHPVVVLWSSGNARSSRGPRLAVVQRSMVVPGVVPWDPCGRPVLHGRPGVARGPWVCVCLWSVVAVLRSQKCLPAVVPCSHWCRSVALVRGCPVPSRRTWSSCAP